MKKMKRLIVMLMVVTMLGASLSGCGKKEDTATSGNSETGGLDTSKEVE